MSMLTYVDEDECHDADAERRMRNAGWRKLRKQKAIIVKKNNLLILRKIVDTVKTR